MPVTHGELIVQQNSALLEVLRSHAAARPDAACLSFGDRTYTYSQVWAATQRFSAALSSFGVLPGDRVVIHAARDPEFIFVLLGLLNLGACYVPMDIATPSARMQIILGEVMPALVVGSPGGGPYGPHRAVTTVDLMSVSCDSTQSDAEVSADALAYIIYTSGSTGRPKGVEVTHAMVANLVAHTVERLGLGTEDVFTSTHSFAFDVSVWELWAGWWSGGHVVIGPSEVARSGPALLELCCDHGVTVVSQTPTAFDQLMAAFDLDPTASTSIRYVILAGEALDFERVRAWTSRHARPLLTPVNMYGITEITIHGTFLVVSDDVLQRAGSRSLIGMPMAGNAIKVLRDDLTPVAPGEAGEAYVSGPGVTRGYHARPGQTAARFVACIDGAPGQIMYRSGDRMRTLEDGSFEFLGRVDDQVKINGFRIELGDVEAAVQAIPQIQNAAVIVRRQGERTHLLAYVIPASDGLDRQAVRAALADALPAYMRPHALIEVPRFPLTVNGKLDKAALPLPARSDFATAVVTPPRSNVEKQLCRIWEEVLGVGPIGIADDFLDLGGDSMAALQVVVRFPEGLTCDPSTVLRCRTIARLAEHLSSPHEELPGELRSGAATGAMSAVQERFWFEQEADPTSAHLNVHAVFRLTGDVDDARLLASLQRVVEGHDILGVRVVDDEMGPRLVTRQADDLDVPVRQVDFTGQTRDDVEMVWRNVAERECSRPFDLRRGLPVRALLAQLGPDEWGFVLNLHHMVADGWSVHELLAEFGAHYSGSRCVTRGEHSYADFTAWRAAPAQKLAAEQNRLRVLESLTGYQPPVTPEWARGSGVEGTAGASRTIELDERDSGALRRLATDTGHSLYGVLMGCVGAALSWSLEVDDIVLATITNSRNRREWLHTVGPLIETLPVRITHTEGMSLEKYLDAAGDSLLGAMGRDNVPLQSVLESVRTAITQRTQSLASAVVTMQQPWETLDLGTGITVAGHRVSRSHAVADLSFEFRQQGAWIDAVVEYRTGTYTGAFIDLLLSRFRGLISEIASGRHALPVRELMRPGGGELATVIAAQDSGPVLVRPRTVVDRIDSRAHDHPHAIAVSEGTSEVTYAALWLRSTGVAAALQEHWERPAPGTERLVMVLLPRGVNFVAALLGVWYADASYVPVDPSTPPHRVLEILAFSGACAVITDGALRGIVSQAGVPVIDVRSATEQPQSPRWERRTDPHTAAYVMYTSGSTGTPKGVVITHEALDRLCAWHVSSFDVGPTDRVAHTSGLGFDASAWEIWPALSMGARIDVPPPQALGSMRGLADWFTDQGTTITFISTPLVELLLDEPNMRGTRLRTVLTGGDTLHRQPPPGTRFTLVNNYGPTESTVVTTSGVVPIAAPSAQSASPSIGRVRAGVRAYVLDGTLQRVAVGIRGELYIGGSGIARGYLHDPSQTATRFVADPFGDASGRMYRTGDIVRLTPDGTFEFLGRADNQVKVRGNRVELGEIQAAINAAPGVARAAVVDVKAHDDVTVVAFVVPQMGGELDPTGVLDELRDRLPAYMIPSAVVLLNSLPLTTNGKVDRAALRDCAVTPAHHSAAPRSRTDVGPSGEAIDALTDFEAIFASVLGVPDVAADTNFFASGGDSIKALRVCAEARRRGLTIVVRDLFQWQTPAELARHLGQVRDRSPQMSHAVEHRETQLLPAQHLLMTELAYANVESLACFHQVIRVRVPRSVSEVALHAALRAVVNRHDALRTRVTVRAGRAVQQLSEGPVGELLRVSAANGSWCLQPMNITAGEMVRAQLSHHESNSHLSIAIHHLAVDAVSWRTILRDLSQAYDAIAMGSEPFDGRDLPPSVHAVTRALYELPSTTRGEMAAATWNQLEVAPSVTEPSGSLETARQVMSARVSTSATSALRTVMPQRHRVDMDDILVTAALRVLREVTGRCEHRLALEGHGRDDLPIPGIDEAVGWLTSYVPVRLADHDGGWADRLRHVRSALLRIPRPRALYGVLRYGGGSPLMMQHRPRIAVNYLGELDGLTSALIVDPPQIDLVRSPDLPNHHALDIVAHIEDRQLVITLTGDGVLFSADQVEEMTQRMVRDIEDSASLLDAPHGALSVPEDFGLINVRVEDLTQALAGRNMAEVFPLTAMQQAMLVGTVMDPSGRLYVETIHFDIYGFDSTHVATAWSRVVDAHCALRIRVCSVGESDPFAMLEKDHAPELVRLDWSGFDPAQLAERTEEFIDQDRSRGIDTDRDALSRIALIDLPGGGTKVVWTFHHSILDGWNISIVVRDLRLALTGTDLTAGPDYATVVTDVVRSEGTTDLSYWRSLLSGFTGPTPWPRGGASTANRIGASTSVVSADLLGPDGGERLRAIAARSGWTVSSLLHAAWAVTLAGLGGGHDVCFGTTVSGRSRLPGPQADVVGLLINTLPVRLQLVPHASWRSLVSEVQQQMVGHLDHEYAPLHTVAAAIGHPVGQPLFHTNLVFENYPDIGGASDDKTTVVPFDITFETATNFPLTLAVLSDGPRCALAVHYDPGVVAEYGAVLVRERIEQVLERVEVNPDQDIADLIMESGELYGGSDVHPGQDADHPAPAGPTEPVDAEFLDALREVVRTCVADVMSAPMPQDDDDLIAQGLSSLDLMRLVARLERALGLALQPSAVFADASVHGIVRHVSTQFMAASVEEETQ